MTIQLGTSLPPTLLLGAGGHARVVLAAARASGRQLLGVCDPGLRANGQSYWEGLSVLGGDEALNQYRPEQVSLLLGVGQLPRNDTRAKLYKLWRSRGYSFPPLVHPTAWVALDVVLSDGVQIMAGVVIQPGCVIGSNTIINTRASVDHDCHIGGNVHIAPGAVLCGGIAIDANAFIGAGAAIVQNVSVGGNAIVGAGVTLLRDVAANAVVVGAANRCVKA